VRLQEYGGLDHLVVLFEVHGVFFVHFLLIRIIILLVESYLGVLLYFIVRSGHFVFDAFV
jgi:hypothetical protein